MLSIELDGSQHLEAGADDTERTAALSALGWRVLRFWNNEVRANPDGVAAAIIAAVGTRPGATHP